MRGLPSANDLNFELWQILSCMCNIIIHPSIADVKLKDF